MVRTDCSGSWWGVALFLGTLLVYRIDPSCVGGGDTVGLRYLPLSLLREGDFDFDEFPGLIRDFRPSFLEVEGHYYSVFPIGGAVLITPVYALAGGLGLDVWHDDVLRQRLVGWIASLLSAVSVVVVYATFASRGPRRAFCVAVVYGLGTSVWPMCAQDLWQHTFGVLGTSVCLLCIERGEQDPRRLGWLGLVAGVLFFVRPPNAVLIALLGLWVLVRSPRQVIAFVAGGLPFLIATLGYNAIHFGDVLGAYSDEAQSLHADRAMLTGLTGLLASPARGLFVYSPVLALGMAALRRVCEPPGLVARRLGARRLDPGTPTRGIRDLVTRI